MLIFYCENHAYILSHTWLRCLMLILLTDINYTDLMVGYNVPVYMQLFSCNNNNNNKRRLLIEVPRIFLVLRR